MEMMIVTFETYLKDVLKATPHEWFGVSQTSWSNYKKVGIPEKHIEKIYEHFGKTTYLLPEDMTEIIIRKYYEKI